MSDELDHRRRKVVKFLARVLQYVECPQYLRKTLFPVHTDLKFAGVCHLLPLQRYCHADTGSCLFILLFILPRYERYLSRSFRIRILLIVFDDSL